MKNLIVAGKEINFIDKDNKVWIDSRDIAKVYEKRHKDVLRAIDNHIETLKRIGEYENLNLYDALLRHREYSHKLRSGGVDKRRYYLLSRDMFNIVVLKFQGDKAMKFTIQFIKAFNAMEKELLNRDVHVEELEHVKKAQLDLSTYGTLSKANKLHARTKQVKSYVRSDKNNPLSVLLGQKARLTQKLNGLFDDEIKKELERLEVKIEMVADSLYQEIKNLNKRIGGK